MLRSNYDPIHITLHHQVPSIEACEAEVHVLLKERADARSEDARTARNDLLDEITELVPGQVLMTVEREVKAKAVDEFGCVQKFKYTWT